ncbi:MAG: primosomal protein N' [Nitrospirae bacterium]|nr:primosomal protein N' [Nitrospirota bacterium]
MYCLVLFPIDSEAFIYVVPQYLASQVKIGARVIVPFKNSKKIGVIVGFENVIKKREGIILKEIEAVLDESPLLSENLIKLIHWVGNYYISTSGVVLKNALPAGVLEGKKYRKPRVTEYPGLAPQSWAGREQRLELTTEQESALMSITNVDSGVFLLHGVTGSGKTEVYMRAIEALPEGAEALVLVPEIALTSQIVDRFRSHFGEAVAVLHSGLGVGERIKEWWRIRKGEVRVAIGVRSAVFAPFMKLGLIVIDEEHEATYKQSEGLRYNARDVALVRAKIEPYRPKIILGSATPSMEVCFSTRGGPFGNSKRVFAESRYDREGNIFYLGLTKRIDSRPMPEVQVLDMKIEEKETPFFSKKIVEALKEAHIKGHQGILMLNRRGYSPFIICGDCGYIYRCPHCSITLTYHKDKRALKCHYCGLSLIPDEKCPKCGGIKFRYIGLGTQRVEEELRELFPELHLRRMDRDTTRRKLSHYRIIKEMENGATNLLIGTQMVARGHDLPSVTVAGIVFADMALNIPDFRSGERAFQLFTQLCGRAGRGLYPGRVFIQTYEPEHYVFEYVKNHDYAGFYKKEINLRRELGYPPFNRLIRIILSSRDKKVFDEIIEDLRFKIKDLKNSKPQAPFKLPEILGPVPAPMERLKGYWRWHLLLKGKDSKILR